MRAWNLLATGLLLLLGLGAALAEDAPAPPPPKPSKEKDLIAQMGEVAFVLGLERGRAEVKFSGKPAMFFLTSANDACRKFAAQVWNDKSVLSSIAGYTPVLVDAAKTPKEWKEKFSAKGAPAVVWVDFDENQIYCVSGDADLEMFRAGASVASEQCPDPRQRGDGYGTLLDLRKKLEDATAANDVKAQLAAIAEIRKFQLGAVVQKEAMLADQRLAVAAETEIQRAKDLLATRGSKQRTDAKKILAKLVADYGAEHVVGQKAQDMLDELAGKKKPPAPSK